jgi:hypothetical protein
MRPEVPQDLFARTADWAELHRWERSELGKALRRLGLTYREIRDLIPVPKGTLSYWCRDIDLSEAQIAAIKKRSQGQAGVPKDTQWRRRLHVERIRSEAIAEIPVLIEDSRWVAGTVLYWAEGSKTQRWLALANTDPEVLRVFVRWVRSYHDAHANFSLMLHLHEGNDERAARERWRCELDLPDSNWHKTFIKPKGTGHRKNHLAWGVCRVRVRRSADAFVRTMAWIEGLYGRLS